MRYRSVKERERYKHELLAYTSQYECVSLRDYMMLLNLTENAARELLGQLVSEGHLVPDHRVYRPVGVETTVMRRESAIRSYLVAHGPRSAAELSAALNMAPRMVQRVLNPMIVRGEAVKTNKGHGSSAFLYQMAE